MQLTLYLLETKTNKTLTLTLTNQQSTHVHQPVRNSQSSVTQAERPANETTRHDVTKYISRDASDHDDQS